MAKVPLLSQPHPVLSTPVRTLAKISCASMVLMLPAAALADCVADATGQVVTCTGTPTGYTNATPGLAVSVTSGTTVSGPIIIGDTGSVSNAGSVTGVAGSPTIQLGNNGSVTNNGTISSPGATAGSAGIVLGDYGVVTNNGSLSAVAGTNVLLFGRGGTFNNSATATAAVIGNLSFGPGIGADISTINNYNVTYGISGAISTTGNTSIYNSGLISGNIVQIATGGSVAITNDTGGVFTGAISTGDQTALVNNGTMSIISASAIGSLRLGATSYVNQGTLSVGSSTAPTQLAVYGNFSQGASGILNIGLKGSATGTPAAGTSYSQVYAIGANGSAVLAGTINLMPAAGFYPSGSTYNVVLADQGVTGSFSTITGNTLPFITFVPVGVVTISGTQQAYQFQALRSTTYAAVISSVATPNQLAVAAAFNPIVNAANLAPTGDAATLVGGIDLLTVAQAQTLFDQVSPEGYLGYAAALRDQMNLFNRQVALRLNDQNSRYAEYGWWLNGSGQGNLGKTKAYASSGTILNIAGGYDFSGPHYVIGAAAGYSSDSLSYPSGSLSGHNNAYTIGAYAGYKLGRLTANAQVDYDLGNFTATKTMTIGSVTRTANASAKDHLFKAIGTLTLDLGNPNLEIAPFVEIDYAKGSINGFTETGATTADLTVSGFNADRTDVLGGLYVTKKQGKWRPYLRAAYRSELGTGAGSTISAYLNGDPTTAFTVTGTPASRKEVDVDGGLNVFFEDEGVVFLGYQGTYRDGTSAHGINAGIHLEF
jgi:uncharacterized protein with beta-barrel porin domain